MYFSFVRKSSSFSLPKCLICRSSYFRAFGIRNFFQKPGQICNSVLDGLVLDATCYLIITFNMSHCLYNHCHFFCNDWLWTLFIDFRCSYSRENIRTMEVVLQQAELSFCECLMCMKLWCKDAQWNFFLLCFWWTLFSKFGIGLSKLG